MITALLILTYFIDTQGHLAPDAIESLPKMSRRRLEDRCPFDNQNNCDFTCAAANNKVQLAANPHWWYHQSNGEIARNSKRQPFAATWEPVLEPVKNCNGLKPGELKEFKFLVALDDSWVKYYKLHKKDFARQGYTTIEASPRLLFDRASYLYEKQFGIRVSVNRAIPLPGLMEKCAKNKMYAEDNAKDNTNTREALRKIGISLKSTEAGIWRFGVGSADGTYCHSYAGFNVCPKNSRVNVVMKKPFNSAGRLNQRASITLAHELGHQFGICSSSSLDCLQGHTDNDIPDIMVYDGRPANKVRTQGMFMKFFTTCTSVYKDLLCKNVQAATCARDLTCANDGVDCTTRYWTVQGRSQASVRNRSEKHKAQCCTVGSEPVACVSTNLGGIVQSATSDTECSGDMTWGEADTFCRQAGLRLCTRTELEDDNLCKDSGCGYENARVWTISAERTPAKYNGWTKWFDRDDPSGAADAEGIEFEIPNHPCNGLTPLDARCVRVKDGMSSTKTGKFFIRPCGVDGLNCLNADNPDGGCDDYKVKYLCPWRPTTAKTCYSVGDPHLRTFDGVIFHNHERAWKTLYEKGDLKVEAEQAEWRAGSGGGAINKGYRVTYKGTATYVGQDEHRGSETKFDSPSVTLTVTVSDFGMFSWVADRYSYNIYITTADTDGAKGLCSGGPGRRRLEASVAFPDNPLVTEEEAIAACAGLEQEQATNCAMDVRFANDPKATGAIADNFKAVEATIKTLSVTGTTTTTTTTTTTRATTTVSTTDPCATHASTCNKDPACTTILSQAFSTETLRKCGQNLLCTNLNQCSDTCFKQKAACAGNAACTSVLPQPKQHVYLSSYYWDEDPSRAEIDVCSKDPVCNEILACHDIFPENDLSTTITTTTTTTTTTATTTTTTTSTITSTANATATPTTTPPAANPTVTATTVVSDFACSMNAPLQLLSVLALFLFSVL